MSGRHPAVRAAANEFLGCRRLAVVGVSTNPADFTRSLFRELKSRHYDVVPVNPKGGELEGGRCYARVQDIAPPVEGALLLTPPRVTEQVVRDCVEAGISRVWMHRGVGRGCASPDAIRFCKEKGVNVVTDECPFMFLPQAGLVHRTHGWLRGLRGHA
jgi:predicted CoA-binding protein